MIIEKDQDIIAINKPPGIVVFSKNKKEKSIAQMLSLKFPELNEIGNERKGAVHRLDKDTSGVLLFARNEETFSFLQKKFFEQKVQKTYIALTSKKLKKEKGVIKSFLSRSPKDRRKQKASKEGKREAITFFKTIRRFGPYTLLKVFPKTGRKHQIRCHLAYMGCPIAGDNLYGFKDRKDPPGLKRQFLHAFSIKIKTNKGQIKKFIAPLPEDLKGVLREY